MQFHQLQLSFLRFQRFMNFRILGKGFNIVEKACVCFLPHQNWFENVASGHKGKNYPWEQLSFAHSLLPKPKHITMVCAIHVNKLNGFAFHPLGASIEVPPFREICWNKKSNWKWIFLDWQPDYSWRIHWTKRKKISSEL